jgi:hypothetical protein
MLYLIAWTCWSKEHNTLEYSRRRDTKHIFKCVHYGMDSIFPILFYFSNIIFA